MFEYKATEKFDIVSTQKRQTLKSPTDLLQKRMPQKLLEVFYQ